MFFPESIQTAPRIASTVVARVPFDILPFCAGRPITYSSSPQSFPLELKFSLHACFCRRFSPLPIVFLLSYHPSKIEIDRTESPTSARRLLPCNDLVPAG